MEGNIKINMKKNCLLRYLFPRLILLVTVFLSSTTFAIVREGTSVSSGVNQGLGAYGPQTEAAAAGIPFVSGAADAAGAASDVAGKIISSSGGPTTATSANATIFQGTGIGGGSDIVNDTLTNTVSKETDIKSLIIAWTNFILPLAATVAVLAIVWAGFLYVTAFGDDGRIDSAKNIIMWVVVGLLVIAAAYAIVNFVMEATF